MNKAWSYEFSVVITGRNEVVAKVMFLQVSVILLMGEVCIQACIAGGIPACLATGLQAGVSALGGCLLWGCLIWGVSAPRGCLLQGVSAPGGVCSGRSVAF